MTMSQTASGVRYAEVERETTETHVRVVLDLDGGTRRDVSTGIGFLDHMLQLLAFHGEFDLGVSAEGDLYIDDHHTVEDIGIVLGQAVKQAIAATEQIERYGSNTTPMDEALVLCAVDVSGRGALHADMPFRRDRLGDLSTEAVLEFFGAFARHAGITIHLRKIAGENDHHLCEACFKALGRALHAATRRTERRGPPSTKGVID